MYLIFIKVDVAVVDEYSWLALVSLLATAKPARCQSRLFGKTKRLVFQAKHVAAKVLPFEVVETIPELVQASYMTP